MNFNIKDALKKIKKRTESLYPEKKILKEILQKYIPEIESSQIILTKGKLSFKNISPTKRTFIKIHKQKIKKEAKGKDIVIRDII